MFNLSYTILTRNLVHGLQEKKEKKKRKNNRKTETAIWFISIYYKCIKDPPSSAAEGSRTLRNIPLVCLRKVTHIAL